MTKQQWIEKWGYIIPFEALQHLEEMANDAFPPIRLEWTNEDERWFLDQEAYRTMTQ